MKLTDWAVRALVVATFLALLVAPNKLGGSMALLCTLIVGLWALFYPQGVLGWAKTAHPSINVDDRSLWWVPRLIGAFFIVLALLIAIGLRLS